MIVTLETKRPDQRKRARTNESRGGETPSGEERRRRGVLDAARPERVERLLERTIEYMPNAIYEDKSREAELLEPMGSAPRGSLSTSNGGKGLTPYLASLYEVDLLTAEQERQLFQKMNFLKYKAATLRAELNVARATRREVDRIERLLTEADEVRNIIWSRNLRLVVSIAKRYVDAANCFSDLVSDGNMSLLRAVEKFDVGRGFRFSTYATWAIRKNFHREIARNRTRRSRFVSGDEQIAQQADRETGVGLSAGQRKQMREEVLQILGRLPGRERAIVVARFGLAGDEAPQTLQEVAQGLGVCKERVRQLQLRAMKKLEAYANEAQLELPEPNERF